MATKENKAIKKLKKQVKKFNARLDDMGKDVKGMKKAWPDPNFSEEEVELAEDLAEEAEEMADLIEKSKSPQHHPKRP